LEKKLVFPGDFLAEEEEFEPGKNTFEDKGKIFSNSFGRAVFDSKEKTIQVLKKKPQEVLEKETIVIGRVVMVKSNMVSIELFSAEKNGEKRIISSAHAVLPIRNISREFVKKTSELFKIGDIVKAKVAVVTPYSVDLKTNEPELGAIKAFCSKCRNALVLFGNTLKCTSCGLTEHRKLSSDYLLK